MSLSRSGPPPTEMRLSPIDKVTPLGVNGDSGGLARPGPSGNGRLVQTPAQTRTPS